MVTYLLTFLVTKLQNNCNKDLLNPNNTIIFLSIFLLKFFSTALTSIFSVIQRQIELCEEESPYANFGEAKRASVASDDNEDSEYSSLNRLRTVKVAQGEQTWESTYTNLTRKYRHDTSASPLQERYSIRLD